MCSKLATAFMPVHSSRIPLSSVHHQPSLSVWQRRQRGSVCKSPGRSQFRQCTTTLRGYSKRSPLTSCLSSANGIMLLSWFLGQNLLQLSCTLCHLTSKMSLIDSLMKISSLAAFAHPSLLWDHLCSLSKKRMVVSDLSRTVAS